MSAPALTIHEWIGDDGGSQRLDLAVATDEEGHTLIVREGSEADVRLPLAAIHHVMNRYGRPLDAHVVVDGPYLDLGDGSRLHCIRHRGRYDVIARDFVVLVATDTAPVAELGVAVSAPLLHLARRARAQS